MAKTGRVALAQTVFHNKESLVLIRSVKRRLVLHFLYFKDEIRDFDAIAKGDGVKLPAEQLELGMSLIEKMSSEDFEPEPYADEYRERALAMDRAVAQRPGTQSRPFGAAVRSSTSSRR